MTPADIAIAVEDPRWVETLPEVEALCRQAAIAALADAAHELGPLPEGGLEVSLVLADDAMVQDLNLRYRGLDKPTNVLSFAALDDEDAPEPEDGPLLLGDVIIALETTVNEAAGEGKTVGDHLAHLVVHGVLHLLGFDHEDDDEAEEMEAKERLILGELGIADPYLETAEEPDEAR